MALRVANDELQLTPAEKSEFRQLFDSGALRVGTTVEVGGRTLVVRGFDPVTAHSPSMYLHDPATWRTYAVAASVFRQA